MKLKLLCYILGVVLLLSACGIINKMVITDITETQKSDTKREEVNILHLSSEYQKIFQDYRKTKSDELLKELNPLTICAFYFLAGEYGDYETQYALIDAGESSLVPSKEDYLKDASFENKKTRDEFLERLRKQVIYAETVTLDNGQCLIVLEFKDGQKGDFRLTRFQKDIWKVSYLPMQ